MSESNLNEPSAALPPERAEQLKRWRLILGREANDRLEALGGGAPLLSSDEQLMDDALAAIYDGTSGEAAYGAGGSRGSGSSRARSAGLGSSAPQLARWLGDVRRFFPPDVVSVIQGDAIERKGLTRLLFEPETLSQVKPDINMVATLLSLKGQIPEYTKETARELIRQVVEEIRQRLEQEVRQAVTGALNRHRHSPLPSLSGLDWKTTIRRNLKHYSPEQELLIPERFYFFERMRKQNEWTIILDIDQSGSMASSVIYASVVGSILASLPAIDTRVVAFDTQVVDLTEQCAQDPVDMLFGIQLGGGTDIEKSVAYCQQFVTDPKKTMFILLSDLIEGGNLSGLLRRMRTMHESGVKVISLLALSDEGEPIYDHAIAGKLAGYGIPCFGCTPDRLPELLELALKGRDLSAFASMSSAARSS